MSLIVCATGNGDRSRSVQARAVEAARRQQKRLVFVHVVDVGQLAELDESLREAAQAELAWLGSAIMRLALPPFLEPRRQQIEQGLKPLN